MDTEEIIQAEIEDAIEEGIQQGRAEAARDILIDLADFLGDNPIEDAGIRAAMEIIRANYVH